ncbi:MAG: hypothetical protein M3Z04_15480 [Chloroflexota bacterium]|nr:hypothetical protein [Chloroflexota bacterium]
MLDSETAQRMLTLTTEYWDAHVKNLDFVGLASGKEIGHRIAQYVDEHTTKLIIDSFSTTRQYSKNGKLMPRSMGDVWVFSNGIYNPINVKAGEANKKGQPNMVALKRLLQGLLLHQIDSYYLLIVKVMLKDKIHPFVYLVDILDHLEYVTYNAGPGQIMLKERQFYQAMEAKVETSQLEVSDGGGTGILTLPTLTLDDKIAKLFEMLMDGDRRLLADRNRVRAKFEKLLETHRTEQERSMNQSALNLKPDRES